MIGDPIRRREDPAFLTGRAAYTADRTRPGTAHVGVVRSQFGRARITGVDAAPARARDDVVAVFTARDIEASGYQNLVAPPQRPPPSSDAELLAGVRAPDRPILADDAVNYDGQPVALVVAADPYVARDAVDAVQVEYDRLDAVVDPCEAVEEGAPAIHASAPDNVAFDWERRHGRVDDAFAEAAHAVEFHVGNQRLAPNALDTRGILTEYDPTTDRLTVEIGTQTPHRMRSLVAETLGHPENRVDVVTPEMGGAFGSRSKAYPTELAVAWCATQLDRPVAWKATRTESHRTTTHGRAHDSRGELAFDDEGRIRAIRARSYADVGAYVSTVAPFIHTEPFAESLPNQYDVPAVSCRVTGVFTNAAPTDSYRGVSRPQATLLVEQMLDQAARELGVDPVELRRRNFLSPEAFPVETATGATYDSADYERTLQRALDAVDYEALRDRQTREGDRRLGVGVGCFVDNGGDDLLESALVRVHPSGTVTAYTGTHDHGQGHHTTFAQLVADRLGVPYSTVEVRDGSTAEIPEGTGTFDSRSAVVGGGALLESADAVLERARRVAAHHFEAAVEDVEYADGAFSVAGAPEETVPFETVAELAHDPSSLPGDLDPGLEVTSLSTAEKTYSYGAHVAVVEVDTRTGEVDLERYVAVDDCGTRLNPVIVEGQVHGAVAQGIGQALFEGAAYNASGTLVNASFSQYAVPRAGQLPEIETDHTVTPSPRNALGVKGIGESGAIGAPAAVVNAVLDALPGAVDDVDLPLTDERVFRLARSGTR